MNLKQILINANAGNTDAMKELARFRAKDLVQFIDDEVIKYVNEKNTMSYSLFVLGLIDFFGIKKDKNYIDATDCFKKAIADNKNNTNAINALGYTYYHGHGIKQDYNEAFRLYENGAKLGNMYCLCNIGNMYHEGYGVVVDIDKAIEYYNKAIDMGNTDAMCNLASIYRNNTKIDKNYDKARELYERAVKLKDSDAMCYLGHMYLNGEGVKENHHMAKLLYQQAIQFKNNNAVYFLGRLHKINGNFTEAVKLYEEAVKLGDHNAMNSLAIMYQEGTIISQDYPKAFQLYKQAIDLGNHLAMKNLALWYLHGNTSVDKNDQKAIKYYQQSIKFGGNRNLELDELCKKYDTN